MVGTYNMTGSASAFIYFGCTLTPLSSCSDGNAVRLVGPSQSDFGASVSVFGSGTVVIGAPRINTAYLYWGCSAAAVTGGSMSCSDVNRMTLTGPPSSKFGFSVAASANTVVIGAYQMNNFRGAAYLYYDCSSAASTRCKDNQRVTLSGPTSPTLTQFGWSVSIDGSCTSTLAPICTSTVVIGAPQANMVFVYYVS